ncbi:tetratricopeptide repeat protein [Poriferisphaera corsica]|uniref:Tetratricopeptide repeat protein n=1 Tax=Poriferisphaera corsica TaxID=2528020 RepID=A0A517YRU9_9BACT|nr:tetratricopeptide repeat protein [Poriferisphaera corsica]QDU32941.1 tetratricopeptide repeat protein [Poriferisphaera corsica]
MNRPKTGLIAVSAMFGVIASCGVLPAGEGTIKTPAATKPEKAEVSSPEAAQSYQRMASKSGGREVTVPNGLIAERIAPIASFDEKAQLTIEQVIQRVALPKYLQELQEQGQGYSAIQTDTESDTNQVIESDESLDVYKHLWEGSETLTWAEDLEDVVTVEVGDVDVPESVKSEPSLEATIAYEKGMEAWLSRDYENAQKFFLQAYKIEPDNIPIIRQMGWVSMLNPANRARGVRFFKRVLKQNPGDVEAMHWVGWYEMEEGNWDTAIALLGRVYQKLSSGEVKADGAMLPLTQHYLASAMRRGGYLYAASDMLEGFLVSPKRVNARTLYGQRLMFVGRQIGLVWLAAGDLRNQLNEPEAALAMYEQGMQYGLRQNEQLRLRLAYTKLRLDDETGALSQISGILRQKKPQADHQQIVDWVIDAGVERDDLIARLLEVYNESNQQDDQLAIVISETYQDTRGKLLLVEHLKNNPENEVVYEHLLRQWVYVDVEDKSRNVSKYDHEVRVREGLNICLLAMEGAPNKAGEYARMMLTYVGDWNQVEHVIDAMSEEDRLRAEVQVIYGLSKAAKADMPSASVAFENAFNKAPELMVARLELTKMMLVMRRYNRATELLDGAPQSNRHSSEVVQLRARMFEQQSKMKKALEIYQTALDSGNNDVDILLGKADIQVRMGLVKPCEQTLLDAVSAHPKSEKLYAAVFKLYEQRALELGDMKSRYQRILTRLMSSLPNSRLARMKRGEIAGAQGDIKTGERLLRELLADYPQDIEVMGRLIQVYMRDNQVENATAFIEQQAVIYAANPAVLKLAADYFKSIKNMEKVFVYTEKMIRLEPTNHARDLQLASLYVAWKKDLEAAAILGRMIADPSLEQPHVIAGMLWSALHRVDMEGQGDDEMKAAIVRFPKQAADIAFQWSLLVDSVGNEGKSEQLMLEVLKINPDHGPVNNQLGYRWVMRGENLEEAKSMIERALKVEPENGAYMDSLGWAYYKLEQYEDAVVWLEKATQSTDGEYPVIQSHLGDAYWELGRKGDAVRVWEKARLKLENEAGKYRPELDPELNGLQDMLGQKILKAGE